MGGVLGCQASGVPAAIRAVESGSNRGPDGVWGGVVRLEVNAGARPGDASVYVGLVLRQACGNDRYAETQRLVDAAIATVRHKQVDLWEQPLERQKLGQAGIFGNWAWYGIDRTAARGYQGLTGIAVATGRGDGPPVPVGAGFSGQVGAMNMVYGILTALYWRERSGKGQEVKVDLLSGMLAHQGQEMLVAMNFAEDFKRPHSGIGHPGVDGPLRRLSHIRRMGHDRKEPL
jgi:hypothetical protein